MIIPDVLRLLSGVWWYDDT